MDPGIPSIETDIVVSLFLQPRESKKEASLTATFNSAQATRLTRSHLEIRPD